MVRIMSVSELKNVIGGSCSCVCYSTYFPLIHSVSVKETKDFNECLEKCTDLPATQIHEKQFKGEWTGRCSNSNLGGVPDFIQSGNHAFNMKVDKSSF